MLVGKVNSKKRVPKVTGKKVLTGNEGGEKRLGEGRGKVTEKKVFCAEKDKKNMMKKKPGLAFRQPGKKKKDSASM